MVIVEVGDVGLPVLVAILLLLGVLLELVKDTCTHSLGAAGHVAANDLTAELCERRYLLFNHRTVCVLHGGCDPLEHRQPGLGKR